METPALLECFACSRRTRWRPRPLRLMRPFQPIRCYPEAAPPRRLCTYELREDNITFLEFIISNFIFFFVVSPTLIPPSPLSLLLLRSDSKTRKHDLPSVRLTASLLSFSLQSLASTVTLNQSAQPGTRPWVTTAPRS